MKKRSIQFFNQLKSQQDANTFSTGTTIGIIIDIQYFYT